ncbi:uncharacterized protein LOC133312845 [Gastrolobium bilobum]|uniref:uncharacterized protein LOC133312845 n=1 Tax=Gastrolobium bilobum TaxID=150636 RepID=UPI002AB083B1|nr:uncharacterized protein LOC133312845 [Gastrolobium bilobum]
MLEVWPSLKRTLQCKPNSKEVHDPNASRHQKSNQITKFGKLERSNIKGFIQGTKRNSEKQLSFNPKPKGGIDITNPIIHDIVLDSPNSEIKIFRCCPCPQSNSGSEGSEGPHRRRRRSATPSRTINPVDYNEPYVCSNTRMLDQMDSEHSVIELQEESSRQIIETICGTSSVNPENMLGQIGCILKVQSMTKTLACFEEYREMVKIKADKLQKKHPRCLADGNELLRFHGTTVACPLGTNSSYSLCTLDYCGICQILRHGFSTNEEFQGALGVYTTSTSGKAFDSIRPSNERPFLRKSVIVCRVIAGRIYSPLEEFQEKVDSGFDSLAQKKSGQSDADIEELFVLNPKALLPCFVVIYKQQTMKVRRFNSSLKGTF